MTSAWKGRKNRLCKLGEDDERCKENITRFIEENKPYDFILLQEASKYDDIINSVDFLRDNMTYYHSNIGLEDMVTLWDKGKYEINDKYHIKHGNLNKLGHPYQIIPFKQKILLMNVHAPHEKEKNLDFVMNALFDYLQEHEKYINYRIIIGGDFNYDIKTQSFSINNKKIIKVKRTEEKRKFYTSNKDIITCCPTGEKNNTPSQWNCRSHYDHVMDTYESPRLDVNPDKIWSEYHPSSDHIPVIAYLKPSVEI